MRFLQQVVLTSGAVVFVAGTSGQQNGGAVMLRGGAPPGPGPAGGVGPAGVQGQNGMLASGQAVQSGPQDGVNPNFDFTDAVKLDIQTFLSNLHTLFLNEKVVSSDMAASVAALEDEMLRNLRAPSDEMVVLADRIKAARTAGQLPAKEDLVKLGLLMASYGPFTPPEVKAAMKLVMDAAAVLMKKLADSGSILGKDDYLMVSSAFLPPKRPNQSGDLDLNSAMGDQPSHWAPSPGSGTPPKIDVIPAIRDAVKAKIEYLKALPSTSLVTQSDVDALVALEKQVLDSLPPAPSDQMKALADQIMTLRKSGATVPATLLTQLKDLADAFGPFTPGEILKEMKDAMDGAVTALTARVGLNLDADSLHTILEGFKPRGPGAAPPAGPMMGDGQQPPKGAPTTTTTTSTPTASSALVEVSGSVRSEWFAANGDLLATMKKSVFQAHKNNGQVKSGLRTVHR